MNISNRFNSIPSNINNKKAETSNRKGVSFKGIYIDSLVDIGNAKESSFPPKFLKKDSLLLNEIASKYPNQDCFIRKGYAGRARLEYREKPPEVMVFDADLAKRYNISVDSHDKEYPCVPLILYPNSDLNMILGVPSYISTNPSLPYTVKVGFELHKKLIEQKMKFMDVIGKTDYVDLGGQSIMEKAHNAIQETEIAVTRYLVECAYEALTKRASAKQIYESDYPKIQTVLDAKRKLDLTTSLSKQAELQAQVDKLKASKPKEPDICEFAIKEYPDKQENIDRINELHNYMREQGITLDDSEDLSV